MDKATTTTPKLVPPYIPFATFKTFIETLHNTTIPPRIDSSVTPTMSGQMRGALNSCLKFLDLVHSDEARTVTDNLKPLVDAVGTKDWSDRLTQVVCDAYQGVVGDLDIERATGGQLSEAFRKTRVEGQVLEKCMRFYLSALDEAGLTYSPHFKTRGALSERKTAPKKKLKNGGMTNANSQEDELETPPPDSGLIPFVVSFPDKPAARFWLPKGLTEDDWILVDAVGRAYVKRNSKVQ